MTGVPCMYCGAEVASDAATCPACGAPSHGRKSDDSVKLRNKFIFYFVLLVVACVFFILWLPR